MAGRVDHLASWAALFTLAAGMACSDNKVSAYREPPSIAIQDPADGSTFYDGQDISFRALVVTHDGTDPTELTSQWVADSESMCNGNPVEADGSTKCTYVFDGTGDYSVVATIADPYHGLVNSPPITIHIGENQAPGITLVAPVTGDEFATDDLIVFEATVSDAEQSPDELEVTIVTSLDGDLGFTATPASSGEYTAAGYLSEGTHLVTAKVFDSYGRSDQDTITIDVYAHGPPSVDTVSIEPSPATTGDDLIANPQGWEDKDGAAEKYHYAWYKADSSGTMVVDSGEATDTYPSGKTTKGDLFQVEVTPYNTYGDGTAKTSPTIEIQNSLPTAPSVTITPSSPEPEDNLQCGITTASTDADLDPISYTYEWYANGVLTVITSNVVTASYTANGDTWECVVTPSDGEDEGTAGSASVSVADVSAPDAPVIDTPYAYRNDDSVTLTGTCEAACALTFYCADSLSSWTDYGTCDTAGEFTYTTSLTRGQVSECYATCEDSAGNLSSDSNTVSTEVCDPYDEYEDASGYGDAGSDAIDEWGALSDNGTTTITIEANVLDDDSEDWYVVSTTDDVSSDYSAGIDYYNFAVDMVSGTSDYAFIVYKGSSDPTDQECPSSGSGVTEYNDYVEDVGDGSHTVPSDTRSCSSGSAYYNNCNDMSNSYYIQVFRRSSRVTSCQQYELEITNGVW